MAERRSYSDEEKAEALAALAANGGDVSETARSLQIPRLTLQHWAQGRGVQPRVFQKEQEKREGLAERLEALAHRLVDVIDKKADTATARDAATAMGIAVDKMRLLREQPTSINRDDHLTDDERAAGVAALGDRLRARRAGQPDPAGPAVH